MYGLSYSTAQRLLRPFDRRKHFQIPSATCSAVFKEELECASFLVAKMKHELAIAREVISCHCSKLQDWVDIMTPRFCSEKEFCSTGTLGLCKAFQKDLKRPPRCCCLHFYCIRRPATCLLHLICKRYSSISFISQVTKLLKASYTLQVGVRDDF